MFDSIGSIDFQEKKNKIFYYLKYVIIALLLIPIYFLIRNFIHTYGDVENDVIKLAKIYIEENHIVLSDNTYIPLGSLGEVEGAELCSNASGVIVNKKSRGYKYQAYLKCLDYESEIVDNSDKYITLAGDSVMILNKNEIYEEMGYYIEENYDVKVDGIVGAGEGIYNVDYNIYDGDKLKDTLVRKVIVTAYDKTSTNSGVTSGDVPTLNLLGDTIMIIGKDEKYFEPGYRAVDYKDGKISRKVVPSGKVEEGKVGTYVLTYSITNSGNKTTTKTRTVKVVEEKSALIIDSKIDKLTSGFVITIKVSGSGYTHTILPDGSSVSNTNFTYQITKNGNYSFAVYDIYGNVSVREVSVNDIDIVGPTGKCFANVNNDVTSIIISATDSSGISGYNFIVGEETTGFIKELSKTFNTKATAVTAQAKDSFGNVTTMSCKVTDVTNIVGKMENGIMQIPLLLQTNYRTPIPWGNGQTATVKKSGCGPTSVSMIVTYLTGNTNQNPQEIFEWLNDIQYYRGNGFCKNALLRAGEKYGVTCKWEKLNEETLKEKLLSGHPIIAFMGKGTFTTGGHYIVLKGVTSDGKIAINDPNSESRSKKTYDASLILRETVTSTPFAVCGY